MSNLLLFRIKQGLKVLDGLGIGYILLFLPLMVFPFLFLRKYAINPQAAQLMAIGLSVFILFVHQNRKDIRFINIISGNPYAVFVLEYHLIGSPLLVAFLIFQQWKAMAIMAGLILVIPLIKKASYRSGLNEKLIRLLPIHLFEWRAALRKTFLLVSLFYLIILACTFLPFLSIFLAWFFAIMVSGFLMENEPVNVLESYEKGPKAFLRHKIWQHTSVTMLCLLPVLLSYLAFNPAHWLLVLIFTILVPAFFAYMIILKYSFYEPGIKSMASNTYVSIGALAVFIPFLLPLPMVVAFIRFKKAIKKLNFYLDDFN
jgi:hypothetical protein